MSTFSLPRLLNGGSGGGASRNPVVNQKYGSLNRYASTSMAAGGGKSNGSIRPALSTISFAEEDGAGAGGSGFVPVAAKRKTLNRNGSIARNQFRGIKKQMLETQTSMLIHSMTVSVWRAASNWTLEEIVIRAIQILYSY